jgi:hypothetical protein
MIHSSQDISFKIIPVDNNGIQLKEEAGLPLFLAVFSALF